MKEPGTQHTEPLHLFWQSLAPGGVSRGDDVALLVGWDSYLRVLDYKLDKTLNKEIIGTAPR